MPPAKADGVPPPGGEEASTSLTAPPTPRRRVSRRKGLRVAAVGLIILVAVVIGYLGSAPTPDRLPSDVLAQAPALLGQEIRVRGIVTGWDPGNSTFLLSDTADGGVTLPAVYTQGLPHEIRTGKEAVVLGTLREAAGGYRIEVREVIVGHPK